MVFILLLLFVLVYLGWLVGRSAGDTLFPENNENYKPENSNTTIHYHITEQHLHITPEELTKLKSDSKKNAQ